MRNLILIPLLMLAVGCETLRGVSESERKALTSSQNRFISQLDQVIALKKDNKITIGERAKIKEVATPTDKKLKEWESQVKVNKSRPDLQKAVNANLNTIDGLLKEIR